MRFLIEQARSRQDILKDIYSAQKELRNHLIKIFIWNDNQAVRHWKGEVFAFLNDTSKCKGSNKFLDSKSIYEQLFGNNEDVFSEYIEHYIDVILNDSNNDLPEITVEDINLDGLFNFIKSYCSWLSEQLSKKGFVYKKDVFSKLDELLKQYLNK